MPSHAKEACYIPRLGDVSPGRVWSMPVLVLQVDALLACVSTPRRHVYSECLLGVVGQGLSWLIEVMLPGRALARQGDVFARQPGDLSPGRVLA